MAKASKKRGRKKPAKRKAPSRRKPARKPKKSKRKPAKKKAPTRKRRAKRAPVRQDEPWPIIFAVLVAAVFAVAANWYFGSPAEAAEALASAFSWAGVTQPLTCTGAAPADTWLALAQPHFVPTPQ